MNTLTVLTPSPTNHLADWAFRAKHLGQSAMICGIASLFLVVAALDRRHHHHARPSASDLEVALGGFAILGMFAGALALGIISVVVAVKARRIVRTAPATAGLVTGIIGTALGGVCLFFVADERSRLHGQRGLLMLSLIRVPYWGGGRGHGRRLLAVPARLLPSQGSRPVGARHLAAPPGTHERGSLVAGVQAVALVGGR